jgi:hypothetical protein
MVADGLTKVVIRLGSESAELLDVFHAKAYRTSGREDRVFYFGAL